MDEPTIRTPVAALRELQQALIPGAGEGDRLELVVRTDGRDLPLRDLAAYLQLADNVYGRLQPQGLRSYALRPRDHLRVEEVRAGSLELVIAEVAQAAPPIAIVWLCLKYLPPALESVAGAYDSVQQGLLAKANRERIRQQMDRDPQIEALSPGHRDELATLVDDVLQKDRALVPKAFRFSEQHVRDVELRVEKRDGEG